MNHNAIIASSLTTALLLALTAGCGGESKASLPDDEGKTDDKAKTDTKAKNKTAALCANVDESNLGAVAKCYSAAGKFDPNGRWKFLSKHSHATTTQKEWIASFKGKSGCSVTSIEVLGDDGQYGRVSVKLNCGKCTRVGTDTYAKEGGKWRVLLLDKTNRAIGNKMKNGDKSGALRLAERWLTKDPNSITANHRMYYAMDRTNTWKRRMRKRRATIVRRLMQINPNDSLTLWMAATHQSNTRVAKTFVAKMGTSDCRHDSTAFNVANKIDSNRKRWAFIKTQPDTPALAMQKIYTLGELKKYKEARALLEKSDKAIAAHLKTESSSFAANWAANMGEVYRRLKNTDKAGEWLTRALTFDPNDYFAKRLSRRLR